MNLLQKKFVSIAIVLAAVGLASAQKPALKPTPQSTPATQSAPQTVSYLQNRISLALASPLLRRGQVGVKIVSAQTGETVYERNGENYFVPASNMKSFTVAAALDKLSPEFRFKTSVYAASKPDSNGVILGDLIVFGRGDPSFSEAFYEGEPFKRLDELADAIVRAGVKTIDGSLIADESFFNATPIPFGWEWDDLQWYYGAEVSALSVFDNTLTLKVLPSIEGNQCTVQLNPHSDLVKIINRTVTTSASQKKSLRITKHLGQNIIEISGTVPLGDSGFTGPVAFSRPSVLFADFLSQRLWLKGVTIKGGIHSVSSEDRNGMRVPAESFVEIATSESPPFSVIAAKTMKPSQNLYTELILRALGEFNGRKDDIKSTSDKKGTDAVQELLLRAGVEERSVIQYDGSGLSRHNLITPDSVVKLYMYMDKNRYSVIWRNALTIGGVDGTLKNRFNGTSAEGNIRGKTGTLDQVSALSGYVTSKSGERFVFSILTNNIPNSRLRTSTIDSIVVLLSDFDGKLSTAAN